VDDFRHYSLFLLSFYLRQSGWQRTVLCVFLHRKRTEIHVFKKSSVIIKVSNKTILIDPATSINKDILGKLERNGLDLLMYTHAHYDHYDYTAAMEIFAATGAHIVASPEVAKELKRKIPKEKITVSTHRGKITQSGIDEKAFKMVADLKPQVAVAIHGSSHQNEQFKTIMQDGLADIALILPRRGEPLSLTLKE